jgi:hypothetical protein
MIAAAVLLPAMANAQATILPQIADGGNWYTTIVVENATANASLATLNFLQNTGGGGVTAWSPPIVEGISTQNIQVPAGGTVSLHTPGTAANLTQGWCQLVAPTGVTAYAIYTYESFNGRPNQDGTSQALTPTSRVIVPFDATDGYSTGVAIVNPTAVAETVSVNIELDNGAITQTTLPSMTSAGQLAFNMATQFSFVAGHKGLAEFYVTNGGVAAAAFRFNPTLALTSLPVVPGNGAPVIGGTSSGSATPYVTFSASSLSFQPGGFPSGTVSLSLNLNGSGGTYLTSVNGGFPTLTDGVFASSGGSFSAGALQANVTVPPYGPFATPGGSLFLTQTASVHFTVTPSFESGGVQFGSLVGTLTVTGTPYPGGGTAVTITGPISGNYTATLVPTP